MEFTGERYVTTLVSPDTSYEHWHRYMFAKELVDGKKVLDIASGEGYGSNYLAQTAKSVIGIDIDSEAVEFASKKYKKDNLEFKVGSVEKIPIEGTGIFDVVTSFETIEHVDEEKQKLFLLEVKRLLKNDGLFIVSSPNKLTYSDIPKWKNEFHLKEFYYEEFKDFLATHFKNISILGQKIYASSYLWNPEKKSGKFSDYSIEFTKHGFKPSLKEKSMLYFVAICSNDSIPELPFSLLTDISEKYEALKNQRISELELALKAAGSNDVIQLRNDIYQLRQENELIRKSKFWKLRNYYLKVKFAIFSPRKFYKKYFQK